MPVDCKFTITFVVLVAPKNIRGELLSLFGLRRAKTLPLSSKEIHFENNHFESDGGLKGQPALSPGQRSGFPIWVPLFRPERAKAL